MKNLVYCVLLLCAALCLSCAENIDFAAEGQEKYLVITSKNGHGLGNRLRALASGSALAKQTGRTLVIDWQPAPNELPTDFNSLFKNEILTPKNQDLNLDRAKKIDVNVLGKEGLVEIFVGPKDRAKVIQIESYFRFINQGLSFEDIKLAYVNFLKNLVPVDEVASEVSNFSSSLVTPSIEHRIGIHFRSFTLSSDTCFTAKSPLQIRRDNMLEAMGNNAGSYFFVATDDQKMLSDMRQQFGNRIVSRDQPADRTSLEGIRSALVDWYLLTKTNKLIGTVDSSFSDEAAFLTVTGEKIGIGPRFF